MQKMLLLFVYLMDSYVIPAQITGTLPREHYLSTGTYSKDFRDAFSFLANKACLAEITAFSLGSHIVHPYMVSSAGVQTMATSIPWMKGGLGLSLRYLGNEDYTHTKLGLAYGRRLGNNFNLGMQLNYSNVSFRGYGNNAFLNMEIAVMTTISEGFTVGFQIAHPNALFRPTQDKRLSALYSSGVGYQVSETLFLQLEIVKEEDSDPESTVMLQYNIAESIFLRTGSVINKGSFIAGLGYSWNQFRTDICVSWHPYLGMSPGLLFIYRRNEKTKE